MIKNYLKTAIRNIRRNKLYAGLNILGLSIGLGSFFIIYLFLQNELAYDQFHEKKDRIYRVVHALNNVGSHKYGAGITPALGPAIREEVPEIEAYSRLDNWNKSVIIPGIADSTDNVQTASVDPEFLDFFHLEILAGSKENALDNDAGVLLNESKAIRYFGSPQAALGQTLMVSRSKPLLVKGVFKDLPKTTSIKAELIAPIMAVNSYRGDNMTKWNLSYGDQLYVLLAFGVDPNLVSEKILKVGKEKSKGKGVEFKDVQLQPLRDVHFSLTTAGPVQEKTDKQYIFIFTLVAIFILVCAVFNYISLALSQSVERTKEIGIRKVAGAVRFQLFRQFITESFLYVTLSFLVAIILVELLTPELENLIGRDLEFSVLGEPVLLIESIVFSMVVAVLCALYPAYLSTRLSVVQIFRSGRGSFSTKRLINAVSVFQIVVFVVLICVAVTANKQMYFMRNENLGFDKETQVVISRFSREASTKVELIKNELLAVPGVVSASFASSVPSRVMGSMAYSEYPFTWHAFEIDENYLDVLGIKLKEGRNFLPEDSDSANVVLINETAAKNLDFEGGAIGKTLHLGKDMRIVGIVEDFHFNSKKEPIEATLFKPIQGQFYRLVLKLAPQKIGTTMDAIKAKYRSVTGGDEMNFFFLEDQINSQYKQENVMITLINTFVVVAGVVAFIGLFGISGYSARRRLKEMSIRKVLGASFMAIQKTLNCSGFMRLALATLIAIPVVYYWMDSWLSSFAYRIELPIGLIILAILIASVIVLSTAMLHSIRAYLINPVDVLKEE
ncbi:ABC transporter permease [Roseivirga thermotolerans]|uniref:ABC transporter permease n=1 Tax=Roseivirga thermotolerans TaxID=1758176 RepID=UPI00273D5615|nr:ABC transporter permease [Roseivirga thermotolerans]